MSVTKDPYATPYVTVVFNPGNRDEQVSLGCDPVFEPSTQFFSGPRSNLKSK
jgi:hypothetical protein